MIVKLQWVKQAKKVRKISKMKNWICRQVRIEAQSKIHALTIHLNLIANTKSISAKTEMSNAINQIQNHFVSAGF